MSEKKIITCASYGGTGSSVITDFLKEFENVNSLGDYELAIAHEVDGISDLQYNLVDNWHRLKNDESIVRFINLSKRYSKECNKIFNNKFDEITNKYIEGLVDFTWDGYWHQHNLRYSKLSSFLRYNLYKRIQCNIYKIKSKILYNKSKKHRYEYTPYFKRSKMYFSYPGEKFFDYTKVYFKELFNEIECTDKCEFIAIDQLVPSSNISRYINYFDNIKVIVVDRDPRDLYLLNKLFWNEGWIPSKDIDTFIKWFKLMREHLKTDNINSKHVLYVKFEDLIYNYDEKIKGIMKFLDIKEEQHTFKKKYFNPEISINNTRLWEKYKEYDDDIKLIEQSLSDFCYK